jgi:hypothetical protein
MVGMVEMVGMVADGWQFGVFFSWLGWFWLGVV